MEMGECCYDSEFVEGEEGGGTCEGVLKCGVRLFVFRSFSPLSDALFFGEIRCVYRKSQSCFVLMSRIAKTIAQSKSSSSSFLSLVPIVVRCLIIADALLIRSESSIQYLTVLNYILSRDAALSVLGDEGAQLYQKMTDHLSLYTSLSEAFKQNVRFCQRIRPPSSDTHRGLCLFLFL